MSDLTAYTPRDLDRPDLLDPETDSWVAAVAQVAQLAAYIADTAFVPGPLRGNAPAVAATILYGREVGVAPITALQTMHVVNGRVTMSAELQRSRVLAAGHELEVVESTTAVCRIRGRRRGSQTWTEVGWAIGDARAAGLLSNPSWQKYPRAMLVARASAELCRLMFPDVTHGMAATEELDGETTPPPSTAAAPATPARKVTRAPKTPPPGEVSPRSASIPVPAERANGPASGPPAAAPEPPSPDEAVGTRPSPASPVAAPEPPPPGDDTTPIVETPGPSAGAPPPPDLDEPDRVVASLIENDRRVPATAPPELPDERPLFVVDDPAAWKPDEVIVADPLVGDDADARTQARLKGDGPATRPQTRHVMALLVRLGVGQTRAERLRIGQALVGRRVQSFTELTVTDAGRIITTLLIALDTDNPTAYLRWLVDEEHRKLDEADTSGGIGDE